jgi:hypothetical protein
MSESLVTWMTESTGAEPSKLTVPVTRPTSASRTTR